jgi:hypothetical protein
MTSCKDICLHMVRRGSLGRLTQQETLDYRFCKFCDTFLKTKLTFCPCCGNRMRYNFKKFKLLADIGKVAQNPDIAFVTSRYLVLNDRQS